MVDRTKRPIVPTEHANSREHRRLLAVRANASLPKDATEGMTAPLLLMQYETADLPTASLYEGALAYDTDLDSLVYSDGTSWLPMYEEGTWTPTYATSGTAFTSVTYDAITTGYYKKIGKVVVVSFAIRTDAITVGAATGSIRLSGFPYAQHSQAGNGDFGAGSIAESRNFAATIIPTAFLFTPGQTYATLRWFNPAANTDVDLVVADMNTGADKNQIIGTGTYFAA